MSRDKFLQLANSAPTPEQRGMFLQQHYRMMVRDQINECVACKYCVSPHVGFQGKTPAFTSFVTMFPLEEGQAILEKYLARISLKLSDVCLISLVSCRGDGDWAYRYEAAQICRSNFNQQMALSSSRVFVLLGLEASTYLFGEQPKNMQDVRGNWTELRTPDNTKQYWFVTEHPAKIGDNKVMDQLVREDFDKLGSLIHYAWAVQMTELYPGSGFEHQMSYQQICDVVANDIKAALLKIPPGARDDEFMRIMLRVMRDQSGLAARAFWDDNFARKCGVTESSLQSWSRPDHAG